MDPECIPLCDAINLYPGFETTESCCGHGEHPFWIFIKIDSLENLNLPLFVRAFNHSYNGVDSKWTIQLGVGESVEKAYFLIEGPIGRFDDANKIAECLIRHLQMFRKELFEKLGSRKRSIQRKIDKAKKLRQEYKRKGIKFDDIIEIPEGREDEYIEVDEKSGKKYVRKSL